MNDSNPYDEGAAPSPRQSTEQQREKAGNIAKIACCAPLIAILAGIVITVTRAGNDNAAPMEDSDKLILGAFHVVLPVCGLLAGAYVAFGRHGARVAGAVAMVINSAYLGYIAYVTFVVVPEIAEKAT